MWYVDIYAYICNNRRQLRASHHLLPGAASNWSSLVGASPVWGKRVSLYQTKLAKWTKMWLDSHGSLHRSYQIVVDSWSRCPLDICKFDAFHFYPLGNDPEISAPCMDCSDCRQQLDVPKTPCAGLQQASVICFYRGCMDLHMCFHI